MARFAAVRGGDRQVRRWPDGWLDQCRRGNAEEALATRVAVGAARGNAGVAGCAHHVGRPRRDRRVAGRAAQRRRQVACRQHGRDVERADREVRRRVAARAVGTLRRRRVIRVLRRGRPVDHRHAVPAHAGLVAGLAARGHAGMVHRRRGTKTVGRHAARRVAGLAGLAVDWQVIRRRLLDDEGEAADTGPRTGAARMAGSAARGDAGVQRRAARVDTVVAGGGMALRTRGAGRDMPGWLDRCLVEIANVEPLMALRAVGVGRRGRMIGILGRRRPVDHRDALPGHARLVAGLAARGDPGVVHRRRRTKAADTKARL